MFIAFILSVFDPKLKKQKSVGLPKETDVKTLDFHIFMFFCLCLEGWDKKERPRYGGQPENDIEDLLNEEILGFEEWNVRISCFAMFCEVIFVLLKTNMGFNYRQRGSVSIRAIHASCFALDPFPAQPSLLRPAACPLFLTDHQGRQPLHIAAKSGFAQADLANIPNSTY